MEGKEIIENMSKSLAIIAPRSSAVNVGSLRIQLKYPTAGGAGDSSTLDYWAKRELADKSLIREAFHTANKTGLTPSQLQSELEILKTRTALGDLAAQNCVRLEKELEKAKEFLNECSRFLNSVQAPVTLAIYLKQEITTFLKGK